MIGVERTGPWLEFTEEDLPMRWRVRISTIESIWSDSPEEGPVHVNTTGADGSLTVPATWKEVTTLLDDPDRIAGSVKHV